MQKETTLKKELLCKSAKKTVQTELEAVKNLLGRIDESFIRACEYILNCEGRIVVTGMGKSGHIAHKIAATLASTGTPAFFVHPAEACHGDFGMITKHDVVLAISNSGTTKEILTLLPMVKRLGVPLITLTGKSHSTLAQQADINLNVSVDHEACPLNLAPTASTTAALVMGDAIAIALLEAKGFTEEDFALSHPGGNLGRKLLLRVKDIMRTGDAIPQVTETAKLADALLEMTRKGLGMTAITDNSGIVIGIFTDGDLRRSLEKRPDIHKTNITDLMTKNCTTIDSETLAAKALQLLESKKISQLLVVDNYNKLIGAFNFHDLLQAGIV
ncbi:MAG: KpsF/GutQ family sugar-phosphate isomerase [Gammaproteobacteria bacterium]|nr:KpsF/GutQ family sugar-phosphate isomerase [Gammaproteobacteria bacterium]